MINKKAIKIIIPLVMLCVVIGIWFFQNHANAVNDEMVANSDNEFPLNITNVDLEALKEAELPTIIDFGADECVPCKQKTPVLVTLNEEMQGKAIIQFVDVWKSPWVATNFPIQVIPTQMFVNVDGTPYVPSDEIANTLEFMMHTDHETEEHIFTTHQGGLTEEQMRLILTDMGVK